MSNQSVSSGATVFDRAGRGMEADLGHELRLDEIRRVLSMPSKPLIRPGVPDEVRSMLQRLAAAGIVEEPLIQRGTATACFEMHIGLFVVLIQVAVDLSTIFPYTILEGQISFPGAVEVNQWRVTGGFFGLPREPVNDPTVLLEDGLLIKAELLPPSSSQADAELTQSPPPAVDIVGFGVLPLSYPGLMFTPSGSFFHNTLFKGWQPCT